MILLAADAGAGSNVLAIVVGAITTIVAAVVTAMVTLRSNTKATALQHQQVLDQRGDKQWERLQAAVDEAADECDKARREAAALRTERDEALDNYSRLRYRVWLAGRDPDLIGREPDAHTPPPSQ